MSEPAMTPAVAPTGGAVRTYLDLSTAHVTESAMQELTALPGVLADATPYGAWVWVPSDIDEHLHPADGQLPQCLIEIWRYAQSLGCDYVHLDCDAEIIPQLPHYDW